VKCKHIRANHIKRSFWVPTRPGLLPPGIEMKRKQCSRCGAWLSLGPSNDEPEQVRVEIQAADDESMWRDMGREPPCWEPCLFDLPFEHCEACQELHLARCIAMHGDEQ
jgi:hypothetical protein